MHKKSAYIAFNACQLASWLIVLFVGATSENNSVSAQTRQAASKTTPPASIEELEHHSLDLINSSRREGGQQALSPSPSLMKLARDYADYMLKNKSSFKYPKRSPHFDLEGRNPQQRAKAAGLNCMVHENLGMESCSSSPDMQLLERQHCKMMSEPPNEHNHRANIMNSQVRYSGIGVARDGDVIFLVEEFSADAQ